jgi:hypothetical protein
MLNQSDWRVAGGEIVWFASVGRATGWDVMLAAWQPLRKISVIQVVPANSREKVKV